MTPFEKCSEKYWGKNGKGPAANQNGMRPMGQGYYKIKWDESEQCFIVGYGRREKPTGFQTLIKVYATFLKFGDFDNDKHPHWFSWGQRAFLWLTGYSISRKTSQLAKTRGVRYSTWMSQIITAPNCRFIDYIYNGGKLYTDMPSQTRTVNKERYKEFMAKFESVKQSLELRDKLGVLGTPSLHEDNKKPPISLDNIVSAITQYDDTDMSSVEQLLHVMPSVYYRWWSKRPGETYTERLAQLRQNKNLSALLEVYGAYSFA